MPSNNSYSNDSGSNQRRNLLFAVSAPVCVAIAVWGVLAPAHMADTISVITNELFRSLDWFFMASMTLFLGLALWLAFSRYGSLKLGGEDDTPDFSTASWLSMLFSAGMGVGILFWGVAEPIMHYSHPPTGPAGTAGAARRAMVMTNFHWGLHAWAVYSIGALVLGYFAFRRGEPYLAGAPIRAAWKGRWVRPVAGLADLIAVLAVAFGVAASLVMGTQQLHSGLNVTSGVPMGGSTTPLIILGVITVAYIISASTSLDKGIKWLSNANITLALLLMVFVLIVGPTSFLLRSFVTSLGDYVSELPSMTLRLYPFGEQGDWMRGWTLTYFVWWIAWAPFVGIFIARISRGRTIREFLFGVTFTPTVLSVLWFAVFGGTGLHVERDGAGGLAQLVDQNVSVALFTLFEQFPLSQVLAGVAVVLIFVFLVTSADSATFVLGMLTSEGSFDPPTARKLTWGVGLALLAAGLLLADSIDGVRALAVLGAIPFTFIMLLQVVAFLRVLRHDWQNEERS